MGPRRWTALALIALAVVAIFFAIRTTHSNPESAPGQSYNQAKNSIPSNADTVTPRQPNLPQAQNAPSASTQSTGESDGSGWLLLLVFPFILVAAGVYLFIRNGRSAVRY
jgi:flagellar basal body-associated protein FliL